MPGTSGRPGNAIRGAGLGAEICARERAHWPSAACVATDVRIIGDGGWKDILPGMSVSPSVDYYGSLPDLHGNARAVPNVTSAFSCCGAYFDVRAAGGTSAGRPRAGIGHLSRGSHGPHPPGASPWGAGPRPGGTEGRSAGTAALVGAWREEILERRSYARRLAEIFRICAEAENRRTDGRSLMNEHDRAATSL